MNEIIKHYEVLLFDLDGTVAHSMPVHNKAWIEALGDKGSLINANILQEYAGISTVKTVELLNQRFSWSLDPHAFAELKEETFLKYLSEVKLVPSIFEVMSKYSHKPMAIVSGGPRTNVEKMLSLLNVTHYFKHLVCAEDTALGKPHPDPFLKAAELMKVDPKKCLVFEDGEAGIIGAKAAGMGVVKVDQNLHLSFLE